MQLLFISAGVVGGIVVLIACVMIIVVCQRRSNKKVEGTEFYTVFVIKRTHFDRFFVFQRETKVTEHPNNLIKRPTTIPTWRLTSERRRRWVIRQNRSSGMTAARGLHHGLSSATEMQCTDMLLETLPTPSASHHLKPKVTTTTDTCLMSIMEETTILHLVNIYLNDRFVEDDGKTFRWFYKTPLFLFCFFV